MQLRLVMDPMPTSGGMICNEVLFSADNAQYVETTGCVMVDPSGICGDGLLDRAL